MTTGNVSASGAGSVAVRRRGRWLGDPLAAGAAARRRDRRALHQPREAHGLVLEDDESSVQPGQPHLVDLQPIRGEPEPQASACIDFQDTTGSPLVASTTLTQSTSAEPVYVTTARSRPARYVNRPVVDTSPERSTTSAFLAMYGWAGVSASWASGQLGLGRPSVRLDRPLAVKRPPWVTRKLASNGMGFLPSLRSSRALTLMPVELAAERRG